MWFAWLGRGGVWRVITSVSKYIPPPSSAKSHPVLCILFRIHFCTVISIYSKKYEEKFVELYDRIHFCVSAKGLSIIFFSSSCTAMHKTHPVLCLPKYCNSRQPAAFDALLIALVGHNRATCRPQLAPSNPVNYVCDVTFVSLSSGNPQLPLGDGNHPAHEHVAGMPTFLSKFCRWMSRLPRMWRKAWN